MPADARLPAGFKTLDFFDETTGAATSVKTLDTSTAAKVADPSQVYYSLKTNIDALANFDRAQLNTKVVDVSQINSRVLDVATPSGATDAQIGQINRAIQYGASRGVTVNITVVKP